MVTERRIDRTVTPPPLKPGFVGPGHLMSPIISGGFAETDPFIMLADDHLDIGDRNVGGAHPHAGFETVTLLLEGAIYDRDEGGEINTGEVQWMTAGRGIIHGENVAARGAVRLLQLWLTLPRRDRWTTPDFQDVREAEIPIRHGPGYSARVYSGESGGLRAPTRNHVPVTIVEARLEPGALFSQELPASYNGFVFVIAGSVFAGVDQRALQTGDVGWLDRPGTNGPSALTITGGTTGARFVLYAGAPQGDAIVSHGPFIGDSWEDIARLYREYQSGAFVRMSELAHARTMSASG